MNFDVINTGSDQQNDEGEKSVYNNENSKVVSGEDLCVRVCANVFLCVCVCVNV